MALTKVVASGISTGGDYEVTTLTSSGTIQVGSATTVHTTGIDLGSGNITGHNLFSTGIITAVSFVGDISQATGAAAGLGTALSQDQSNPLNKIYYTDTVLSIGSTQTVNPPDSSNIAYTQYAEIAVEEGFDLIVEDGDDLVPDILGLSTETAGLLAGAGGRVRADQFTNKAGTGAPSFPNGVSVTGVATATSFSGNLTGNVTGNLTGNVTGNLTGDVTGDVTGNVTGSAINVTGVITATSFSGDGSSLTGIDATQIQTGNTSVQTVDTGSDGHVKVTTEGTERLRVTADGDVGIGTDNVTVGSHRALQVHSENTNSYLVLTNNSSGADAANNGVSFVLTGSDVNILNRESGNILLSTNGGERASIRSTGDLKLNHGLTGLTGGGVLVCASSSSSSSSGSWPQTVDFTIPMGNLSVDYDNAVRNYYSSGQTGYSYGSSAGSACLLLASCWNTYYWGYATKLYLCTVYGQSSKTTALQQLHAYNAAGHPSSGASISLSVVSTTSATPKLRATFDGDYWNSNNCEVVMFGGGFANPTCLGPTALTGFHSNLTGQDAGWS